MNFSAQVDFTSLASGLSINFLNESGNKLNIYLRIDKATRTGEKINSKSLPIGWSLLLTLLELRWRRGFLLALFLELLAAAAAAAGISSSFNSPPT